jgi:hypothetical protein
MIGLQKRKIDICGVLISHSVNLLSFTKFRGRRRDKPPEHAAECQHLNFRPKAVIKAVDTV